MDSEGIVHFAMLLLSGFYPSIEFRIQIKVAIPALIVGFYSGNEILIRLKPR